MTINPANEAESVSFESVETDELSLGGDIHTVTAESDWSGENGGEMIDSAINAADAGDEVWVIGDGPDNPSSAPESYVWEVSSHLAERPPDNFTLRGVGMPLLFRADGVEDDIIRTDNDDSAAKIQNLKITGFRFDGNRTNISLSGNQPISPSFFWLAAVRLVNCRDSIIRDCYISDAVGYGVEQKLSNGGLIDTIFVDVTQEDEAISVTDDSTGSRVNRGFNIQNIRANNPGGAAIEVEAMVGRVNISNLLYDTCNGISVEGSKKTNINNVVGKNSGDCLILNLNTAGEVVNAANIIARGADQAIKIRNRTGARVNISNFDFETALSGVRFDNGHLDKLTLSNGKITQQVDDSFSAIEITEQVNDLVIDNVDINCQSGNVNGIRLESASGAIKRAKLSNVTVTGAKQSGIAILAAGNPVSDLHLDTVTTYNCGRDTGASDKQRAGVRIEQTGAGALTDIIMTGIRAFDDQGTKTQQYGIYRDGADYCIYDDCNIRGNSTGSFGGTKGTNSVDGTNIT